MTGAAPWTSPQTGVNSFVIAIQDFDGQLYRSDSYVSGDTSYQEYQRVQPDGYIGGGVPVGCELQPVMQPDNGAMSMNAIVQASLSLKLPSDHDLTIKAINEAGEILDEVTVQGLYTMPITGVETAGEFMAYGAEDYLAQQRIAWNKPLIFKQITFNLSTLARLGVTFGNLYLRYQILGNFLANYPLQPMTAAFNALISDATGLPVPPNLQMKYNAPAGTKIASIVVKAAGNIVFTPILSLSFISDPIFDVVPFTDTATGDTNGTAAISGLSKDTIAAGWDIGMSITDSALELGEGVSIAGFSAGGLALTVSSAAAGTTVGDKFTVFGWNLVSLGVAGVNPNSIVSAQLRIEAQGFRTSYVDFLVTITP